MQGEMAFPTNNIWAGGMALTHVFPWLHHWQIISHK